MITEATLSYRADGVLREYADENGIEREVTLYVQYDETRAEDWRGRSCIARSATVIGGLWFDCVGDIVGPLDRDGLRLVFGDVSVQAWQDRAVAE